MLNWQKITVTSKEDILSVIKPHPEIFRQKLKLLKEKWHLASRHFGDCHEVRTMGPLLFGTITPLNAALIIDNLEYFKEHYEQIKPDNLIKTLMRACLCGSEKIAEFLGDKLNISPLQPKGDFIFVYACASFNEGWAIKIALRMRQAKLPMPRGIHCFTSMKTISAIEYIFVDQQSTPAMAKVKP